MTSMKHMIQILMILKNQLKMIRRLENELNKQQNGNKQLCDTINILQNKVTILKLKAKNKRNIKIQNLQPVYKTFKTDKKCKFYSNLNSINLFNVMHDFARPFLLRRFRSSKSLA